ncbi:MAG: zf-HC2 domain-containing protein [Burkholderiales bacterium]|nr:zf-HC2 domain-containing protein [Burkholderiales bacterium]MDE1927079.1 zf-HC2 domain-containing protein [Burkholderiales bacterium]MDE2160141.1 zf-HC2 domain-containing protein [Burkholderiales bacterium]MDE2504675.1 zf-HC2 domain-containing protein [Burkholderiales bacterium]
MLNCRQVAELCSRELDAPLRRGERLGMGLHLMMCSGCKRYRLQMQSLRQAMATYAQGGAETDGGASDADPAPPERTP